MKPMPDPAKLELLTRAPGEAAFQIVEIDSTLGYWSFKPQRLPATEWELTAQPTSVDGARNYVLKNLRHDRYLLLNTREYFFWEHFDGRHSLEEIARAFHFEVGAFDYSLIRHLLTKLHDCGLLERRDSADLRPSLARAGEGRWANRLRWKLRTWQRVSFKIPDADRFCSNVYNYGGFLLFQRLSFCLIIPLALVALVMAARLTANARDFTYFLTARPFFATTVIMVTLFAASMLHTVLHALACKAHGRRVREMGLFLLQGVWPAFYADVTDIFMSSRWARVTVDLAGPMVEVVLGSVAIIAAYTTLPGIEQAILFGIGLLLRESALINLYPFSFLEMDGYNIIADLMAMPMLRQQAMALIPNLPGRLRSLRTIERAEWIQLIYLMLCLVSVSVYLIAHLDAISALFSF
jgi:putative peptide zinc metalloprotease protein